METHMFENTVRVLAKTPVDQLNTLISTSQITYPKTQLIMYKLFSIQPNTDNTINDMNNMNNNGKQNREVQNQILLKKALIWWSMLCMISIIIFGLYKYCTRKSLSPSYDIETSGTRFLSIDALHNEYTLDRQRKTSYDYADDESLLSSQHSKYFIFRNFLRCNPSRRKKCLCITKYLLFGICVVLFQFLFFQNIVMLYDPLSIDEMKYIIYSFTISNLDKYHSSPNTNSTINTWFFDKTL